MIFHLPVYSSMAAMTESELFQSREPGTLSDYPMCVQGLPNLGHPPPVSMPQAGSEVERL